MNRRLRTSCLALVSLFWFSVAGAPLASINREALRLFSSDVPVAFQQFEKSSPDQKGPTTQDLTAKAPRRANVLSWERVRERSSDHSLVRDLLHQAPVNPGFASKLDLCTEFTKPDSLVIRRMGTPKNHRSPPA